MEQSWHELQIKFTNSLYFEKVLEAVKARYNESSWMEVNRKQLEATVTTSTGVTVNLRFLLDTITLIVTDAGKNTWVMNDYQNICKNIVINGKKYKINVRILS